MALLPTSVDYTDLDQQALFARARSLAKSIFPQWTDFDEKTVSNFLLEVLAHVGDIATFNLDVAAREAIFTAMQQRRSIVSQAKLVDYELPTAVAATAILTCTVTNGQVNNPLLVPAGRKFETDELIPKSFQTLADVLINTGSTSFTLLVEHSETQSEILNTVVPAGEPIPLGFQARLNSAPYLDGSIILNAADGDYVEVKHLIDYGPDDKVFSVSVDALDFAVIQFGNNVNGKVPSGPIYVTYRTGGGALGNVDGGAISIVKTPFTDLSGQNVPVSVENTVKASGGADRETLARAKQKIPASLRAMTRAVAREDFEIIAEQVPGVLRALMLTVNEKPGIAANTGRLHIIPDGGGLPTDALKAQVKDKFKVPLTAEERSLAGSEPAVQYPTTLTFSFTVENPTYKDIDVRTSVFLNQGESPSIVAARIKTALDDFFALANADGSVNTQVDFGGKIRNEDGVVDPRIAWSDIFDLIYDVTGVRKLEAGSSGLQLNGEQADVTLLPEEFPTLGIVTILNAETGAVL